MTHGVRVRTIKITTVEQSGKECGGEFCSGCSAPCCTGMKTPLLTEAEFLSNRFPVKMVDILELKAEVPGAENVIGLGITGRGCPFHVDGICTIYETRPQSCRVYDCRNDTTDLKMMEFVRTRF